MKLCLSKEILCSNPKWLLFVWGDITNPCCGLFSSDLVRWQAWTKTYWRRPQGHNIIYCLSYSLNLRGYVMDLCCPTNVDYVWYSNIRLQTWSLKCKPVDKLLVGGIILQHYGTMWVSVDCCDTSLMGFRLLSASPSHEVLWVRRYEPVITNKQQGSRPICLDYLVCITD